MLFNSIDFIIFFPIVLFVYFVLPKKIRYLWLLAASYYFYMCWNPIYVILLFISTALTYFCGLLVEKVNNSYNWKKTILISGLVLNLGILLYFKYSNFLLEIVNPVLNTMHINSVPQVDVLLPVGISFYIFQALGYLIDVYRGDIQAEHNFFRYALFVSFFPQLVAGPIERSKNLLMQINSESQHKLWNYKRVTDGLITMLWGFFMKIVIADRAAILVKTVFDGYEKYEMTALVAGAVLFAIQIYCDFGGYSTIAIGAAKVLGFELMENFNTPYFALGITDFWRRWHISLSSWFRDYLYIPLGGSRCKKLSKYRNILITFGVSGLWHGANWTYVIWGLLQGVYQVIEKETKPLVDRINRVCHTNTASFGYKFLKCVFTFILVDISWIFFRADTIGQAINYIYRMICYRDWWSLFDQSLYTLGLSITEMNILLIGILALFLVDLIKYKKNITISEFLSRQWIVFRWIVLTGLLFICILFGCYGTGFDSTQFIYFQF